MHNYSPDITIVVSHQFTWYYSRQLATSSPNIIMVVWHQFQDIIMAATSSPDIIVVWHQLHDIIMADLRSQESDTTVFKKINLKMYLSSQAVHAQEQPRHCLSGNPKTDDKTKYI